MTTYLAQNQFITNSVAPQPPPATDSTADSEYRLQNVARPDETAGETALNSVSDGVPLPSLSSMEMEPSVTLAQAPSETEGAVSVSTASSDNHIHEIFFYVRKLMKQPPRFVLDTDAFMAEVEEIPLFIREDGYLKRQA